MSEKPASAPKKKEAKIIQNGIVMPRSGSTARVWEVADELSKAAGGPVSRKEVIEAFVAEGGNKSTASTQYGRWRKFYGLGTEAKVASSEAAE